MRPGRAGRRATDLRAIGRSGAYHSCPICVAPACELSSNPRSFRTERLVCDMQPFLRFGKIVSRSIDGAVKTLAPPGRLSPPSRSLPTPPRLRVQAHEGQSFSPCSGDARSRKRHSGRGAAHGIRTPHLRSNREHGPGNAYPKGGEWERFDARRFRWRGRTHDRPERRSIERAFSLGPGVGRLGIVSCRLRTGQAERKRHRRRSHTGSYRPERVLSGLARGRLSLHGRRDRGTLRRGRGQGRKLHVLLGRLAHLPERHVGLVSGRAGGRGERLRRRGRSAHAGPRQPDLVHHQSVRSLLREHRRHPCRTHAPRTPECG